MHDSSEWILILCAFPGMCSVFFALKLFCVFACLLAEQFVQAYSSLKIILSSLVTSGNLHVIFLGHLCIFFSTVGFDNSWQVGKRCL